MNAFAEGDLDELVHGTNPIKTWPVMQKLRRSETIERLQKEAQLARDKAEKARQEAQKSLKAAEAEETSKSEVLAKQQLVFAASAACWWAKQQPIIEEIVNSACKL